MAGAELLTTEPPYPESDSARIARLENVVTRLQEQHHAYKEVGETKWSGAERALLLKASEYENRLESLNHAHEESLRIQATYITREVHEQNLTNVTMRLDEAVEAARKDRASLRVALNEVREQLVSANLKLAAQEASSREDAVEGRHNSSFFVSIAAVAVAVVAAVIALIGG